jgi:hypothetical protein
VGLFKLPIISDDGNIGEISVSSNIFDAMISVTDAAEIIRCTPSRVRQLLRDGLLRGKKLSERAWLVARPSAEKYAKTEPERGRPRGSLNRD